MTDRETRRGTARGGRRAGAAVLAALFVALGLWIGMRAGDGAGHARTPAEQAVARQALETWRIEGEGGGPLRFLTMSQKVTAIERRPGTCDTKVPDAFPAADLYDYQATLRRYTLFGVPLGDVRFTCGGLAWEAG